MLADCVACLLFATTVCHPRGLPHLSLYHCGSAGCSVSLNGVGERYGAHACLLARCSTRSALIVSQVDSAFAHPCMSSVTKAAPETETGMCRPTDWPSVYLQDPLPQFSRRPMPTTAASAFAAMCPTRQGPERKRWSATESAQRAKPQTAPSTRRLTSLTPCASVILYMVRKLRMNTAHVHLEVSLRSLLDRLCLCSSCRVAYDSHEDATMLQKALSVDPEVTASQLCAGHSSATSESFTSCLCELSCCDLCSSMTRFSLKCVAAASTGDQESLGERVDPDHVS